MNLTLIGFFLLLSQSGFSQAYHYGCHAQLFNRENKLVAEDKKSIPIEGTGCFLVFDLQAKAFSICPNEPADKVAFGVVDQYSSQESKVVIPYGTKTLHLEMVSANDAAYRAELSCDRGNSRSP